MKRFQFLMNTSANMFSFRLWVIECRLLGNNGNCIHLKSTDNIFFSTIKCAKSEGVWILSDFPNTTFPVCLLYPVVCFGLSASAKCQTSFNWHMPLILLCTVLPGYEFKFFTRSLCALISLFLTPGSVCAWREFWLVPGGAACPSGSPVPCQFFEHISQALRSCYQGRYTFDLTFPRPPSHVGSVMWR